MTPEQMRDLEIRAERVHPDEPVATAREVLSLIREAREASAGAAVYASAAGRVRGLARDWIASPDIQIAAAGRIILAAQEGRQGALTGLT